jgi:hypothetical protein
MKHLIKFYVVATFLLTSFLYSCDKVVQTDPLTVDLTQTGTISGYVYADLDLTQYSYEPAPAGTKIIVWYNYSQLGLNTQGKYSDSVKVDATGKFKINIPTNVSGVTVNIELVDFVYDQVQPFNSTKPTIKTLYTYPGTTVLLKTGDVNIIRCNYQSTNLTSKSEIISGKIQGEFDESLAGYENAPAGQTITFFCTGWSKSVTTVADGSYSIEVPYNEYIYYYYDFQTNKNVHSGATYLLKNYRYNSPTPGTGWSSFASNSSNVNINLGTGTLVI